MKKITFLFLLFSIQSFAQVNGNKEIVSQTFPLEAITSLEINLSSNVTIDMNGADEITITTDQNLIPHINTTVKNGHLDLTQKKWIEPSDKHEVLIGAAALRKLVIDAHGDFIIKNMAVGQFKLVANVGKISLLGTVKDLKIKNKVARVNAAKLIAQNANIKITSWGRVTATVENELDTSVSENGFLQLTSEAKVLKGDASKTLKQDKEKELLKKEAPFKNARFIKFKIKNNSLTRKNFVVVGPKSDGSFFSYGFPMWPGQSREKDWTVGSKVYKVSRLGIRKLIVTIKETDEGKVVDLF